MNGRQCEDEEGCTGLPYSWSVEHQNRVLCYKHYRKFIAPKVVKNTIETIQQLSKAERNQLMEALKNAN